MSVEYFMDECTEWEIQDIIDCLPYIDRTEWEQARLVSFIIGKANFKNIKKLQDIAKFRWDDKDIEKVAQKEEHNYSMSNEDIKRLRAIAKQWEKHD